VVLRGKIANASRLTCGPPADPLRDDPATTQSEINEHVDGVRWSFLYCDICRGKRSAYCHRSLVDADVAPAGRCEGSSSKLPNGGEAEASDAGHEVELGRWASRTLIGPKTMPPELMWTWFSWRICETGS